MSEESGTVSNEYSVYEPDREADAEAFPIEVDDPEQIHLAGELDADEIRARLWYFEPGDKVSFHYHDQQEEIYYVVKGTGQAIVGEEREEIEVPEGGAFRPAPETPRQLRNETDEVVVWLIVGAPAVVEAQLWDSYDEETGRPAEDGEYKELDWWF